MSGIKTSDLRDWLTLKYHDYSVSEEPLKGTYGLILFLKHGAHPTNSFAVKTLAPENVVNPETVKDYRLFTKSVSNVVDIATSSKCR